MKGFVYIVGAGPGDPDLLTEKAKECLEKADVILYDYLVNPSILEGIRADLIYVGKIGKGESFPQKKIEELMIKLANEGKVVLRLKGGDPFLFGRGGEEAFALSEASIPFEIVPGISSAIAACAYAGIPVTDRRYSSSLCIITGHKDPKKSSDIDFLNIVNIETIVILMGVSNIENIVSGLIDAGKDPKTPSAAIMWGTTPRQRVCVSTLKDLPNSMRNSGIRSPSVIVVGEVVRLRERLAWFEKKPLFGKKILLTGPKKGGIIAKKLKGSGAEVIELPLIEIKKPKDSKNIDFAIKHLRDFDWLILTSKNGVDLFFKRLFDLGFDTRALSTIKVAVIGEATKKRLLDYHIKADLCPKEFVAESLAKTFSKYSIKGRRILLARASLARRVLLDELLKEGAKLYVATLYDTKTKKIEKEKLEEIISSGIDMVVFTSSSTVFSFFENFKDFDISFIKFACIGPVTEKALKSFGYRASVVAKKYTEEGLFEAILEFFGGIK